MRLKRLFLGIMLSAGIANIGAANYTPENVSVSLKVPGNDATIVSLPKICRWSLPVRLRRKMENNASMLSSKPWRMCISIMESR